MCVQSIPKSKKMGDLPRFRENLIPKLLTTEQKKGSRCLKDGLTNTLHANTGSERSGKGLMFPGCHIGHPCPGSDGSGTPELWLQTVIPQPSCAPRDWEEKHGAPSRGRPTAVLWPTSPGACSPAIGARTTSAAHFLLAQLCSTATGKPLGAIGLSITNGRSQKNSTHFLIFAIM